MSFFCGGGTKTFLCTQVLEYEAGEVWQLYFSFIWILLSCSQKYQTQEFDCWKEGFFPLQKPQLLTLYTRCHPSLGEEIMAHQRLYLLCGFMAYQRIFCVFRHLYCLLVWRHFNIFAYTNGGTMQWRHNAMKALCYEGTMPWRHYIK
jgi:hypothetical protein